MNSPADLAEALRRYWGYDSFRPRQEEIIAALLNGRDVCVVMPTGGGKSLCYQLPAAIQLDRTAVVISPLISLMQDQVAQLGQMGIPAALLNSSLSAGEQSRVQLRAARGEYRLIYISPERLARADTCDWLQQVPLAFFAIDEAHCISEWGHEFRPEYRQLSSLRQRFARSAIAAFTASATRRVRHDIVSQLQLRDPRTCVLSFFRANLRYAIRQCSGEGEQLQLLARGLAEHAGQNVIVYAPTIKRVEHTAAWLEQQGIPALPYHGKMEAALRRKNQERWMADEVRVLVGTIAFGLGINKAAVRAVIHLALPKSLEQYYQEAGRAGRDGQPADCILLWQPRDAALLRYFIDNVADPAEKQRAWQRYHDIHDFAESAGCRQRRICAHFGETAKADAARWKACACDHCTGPPAWLAAEFPAAARQPTRAGRTLRFPTPAPRGDAAIPPNGALRQALQEWRRAAAKQQKVPAFVVMHDSTLDQLCAVRPTSEAELRRVQGMGEKKYERYGMAILQIVRRHSPLGAASSWQPLSAPAEETLRLLRAGHSLDQVASIRGRERSTVVDTVADLIERGEYALQPAWVSEDARVRIEAVCRRLGVERLRSIKDALPAEITFEQIRLVVAQWKRSEPSDV